MDDVLCREAEGRRNGSIARTDPADLLSFGKQLVDARCHVNRAVRPVPEDRLRVGCIHDRVSVYFCDVVSDDLKSHKSPAFIIGR